LTLPCTFVIANRVGVAVLLLLMLAACGGSADGTAPAPTGPAQLSGTVAYVATECVDKAGGATAHQQLSIIRGERPPISVMDDREPKGRLTTGGSETPQAAAVSVYVVSMPCWETFAAQSSEYRESVLPAAVKARVSIEAGVTFGWRQWIGDAGIAIGIDRFGASAPGETNLEKFGFTADNVARTVRSLVK
jgi:hypothetical protein